LLLHLQWSKTKSAKK